MYLEKSLIDWKKPMIIFIFTCFIMFKHSFCLLVHISTKISLKKLDGNMSLKSYQLIGKNLWYFSFFPDLYTIFLFRKTTLQFVSGCYTFITCLELDLFFPDSVSLSIVFCLPVHHSISIRIITSYHLLSACWTGLNCFSGHEKCTVHSISTRPDTRGRNQMYQC